MTIEATVQEVIQASRALKNIGEAKLPPKSAWRVSRLTSKLAPFVRDFQETQRKLMVDHGAEQEGVTLSLKLPERLDKESNEEFAKRVSAYRTSVKELNDAVELVLKEKVSIDYDPIPLSLFENAADENRSAQLAPNDLADAGPFIKE